MAAAQTDCKMREAAEQQRLLADAGGPGSASPSQAAPPAPSRAEQPGQAASPARIRAEQPGQAASPAPSMLSVPEPGSASSSTGVPTQAAPVAGIGTRDVENMKKKELRKVAVSLGVSSRAKLKSTALLREACKCALAGQSMLSQFFVPGAASQESLGPEVGIEAGGAAPVSDSPREVAPDRASKPKRSRVALKPSWMPARKRALSRQREYEKTPARRLAQRTRAAKRYAADFGERAATYCRVKKSRAEKASREAKLVTPKSARADRAGVSGRGGTWKRAADLSARRCQHDGPSKLPPSYERHLGPGPIQAAVEAAMYCCE